MSTSSLDPTLREALMTLVRARTPRGRVMTLTEMEDAVTAVIRQLGGDLMTTLTTEQVAAAEAKGGRPLAAASRHAGGGAGHGRS